TISVRDDNHNAAGAYTVTLEAVSATANGALNGPPAAVPACARVNQSGKADGTQLIERGQPIGGAIDAPGETDTFTFAITDADPQAVTIALTAGNAQACQEPCFDPVWLLFAPDGSVVGGGDQRIDYCTDTCARDSKGPGVYTIKVYDFGYESVGDYTLLLQDSSVTVTTTVTTTTGAGPSTTTTTQRSAGTQTISQLANTLRRPRD